MNCLVSSMNCQPNSAEATLDYLKKKGRLELWSGVLGIRSLERADKEQAANREAESAHVRKTVWGANVSEDGKVYDTYLGDVTHVHPEKPKGNAGGLVKGLIGAGLLASGIGVPVGAWMIADAIRSTPTQSPVQPSGPTEDLNTLYQLRLGKESSP